MTTHHELAPAKVNLSLAVTGRRDDGYHLLESVVAFADVGDELEIDVAPVPERALECESISIAGPFASALHEALAAGATLSVEKAWEIARAAARPKRFSVDLALMKVLPIASGLGGGTSDAAAVLRVLARTFDLRWTREDGLEAARGLGADGPACYLAEPLIMRGTGEMIETLSAWPSLDVVLANCGCAVPTSDVFAAFAERGSYADPGLQAPATSSRDAAVEFLAGLDNSLYPPAAALTPEIGDTLAALEALPGARLARMSGSGATCFAIFDDAGAATLGARDLQASHPKWWVSPARLGGAGAS